MELQLGYLAFKQLLHPVLQIDLDLLVDFLDGTLAPLDTDLDVLPLVKGKEEYEFGSILPGGNADDLASASLDDLL